MTVLSHRHPICSTVFPLRTVLWPSMYSVYVYVLDYFDKGNALGVFRSHNPDPANPILNAEQWACTEPEPCCGSLEHLPCHVNSFRICIRNELVSQSHSQL